MSVPACLWLCVCFTCVGYVATAAPSRTARLTPGGVELGEGVTHTATAPETSAPAPLTLTTPNHPQPPPG
jgi:hypothetical protein